MTNIERRAYALIGPDGNLALDIFSIEPSVIRQAAENSIYIQRQIPGPTRIERIYAGVFPRTAKERRRVKEIFARHYLSWKELEAAGFKIAPTSISVSGS